MNDEQLAQAKKAAKTPEEQKALAGTLAKASSQAIERGDFVPAELWAKEAASLAKKAGEADLAKRLRERAKLAAALEAEGVMIQKAQSALAANPDDAKAASIYGKYVFFAKGETARGLALLAKGSDKTVRKLAELELKGEKVAADLAALADGWDKVAAKEKGPRQAKLKAHALSWLRRAAAVAEGAAKAKLDKKLAKILNIKPDDLLSGLTTEGAFGAWKLDGKTLTSPEGPHARIAVGAYPQPEYDLVAKVKKKSGINGIYFGLVTGDAQFMVFVDCPGGKTSGVFGVGQKEGPNDTWAEGKVFTDKKARILQLSVRKDLFTLSVDGKTTVEWKNPAYASAPVPPNRSIPGKKVLYIGTVASVFEISDLKLIPVK